MRRGRDTDGWFGKAKETIQAILFGYDFFISYRSRDGADFAGNLFSSLEKEGFDCFLDRRYYEAGHNLRWMQTRALKRSTKLLLIVSPEAHVPPATGTDWVLAEILEFKHLHLSRETTRSRIIPIGTLDTLNPEKYPTSKLLPEIPAASGNICVLDDGAAVNGPVSPASIEKLQNDFRQVRRRRVRWSVSAVALAAVIFAAAFGIVSQVREHAADRKRKLAEGFRLLDRGRERLGMNPAGSFFSIEQVLEAKSLYDQSEKIFKELKLDPLMVLHHRFASSLRQLRAKALSDGGKETSYLMPSVDGNSILVVYDYAAPSGSPDREEIPDWTSFGVFDLRKKEWTLQQPISSEIGGEMYNDGNGPEVVAFEAPEHVIVCDRSKDDGVSYSRWSLRDGAKEELDAPPLELPEARATRYPGPRGGNELSPAQKRIEEILSPESLFVIQPENGIDMEYGPRLVEKTHVSSPDGRNALVGTYEGRLILLDLATGTNRGEMSTGTIYAAAFSPDGSKGYFCDGGHLWEVDASLPPGVIEAQVPSREGEVLDRIQGVTLSDDATVLAVATSRRLLSLDLETRQWHEWHLPEEAGEIAAFRIDPSRLRIDLVLKETGAIVSVDYADLNSSLEIVQDSAGQRIVSACFDPDEAVVWMADRKSTGGKARVRALGLPEGTGKENELTITLKEEEDREGERTVHAIAREDSALWVFHGDEENSTDSGRTLLDEEALRYPLVMRGEARVQRENLFPAKFTRNGPDPFSHCDQVSEAMSYSPSRGWLVKTDVSTIYSVAFSRPPKKLAANLFARKHGDVDQHYVSGVGLTDNDVWVEIGNEGMGAVLRYDIPWRYLDKPKLVHLVPSGRQMVLVNDKGELLLLDVTMKYWVRK